MLPHSSELCDTCRQTDTELHSDIQKCRVSTKSHNMYIQKCVLQSYHERHAVVCTKSQLYVDKQAGNYEYWQHSNAFWGESGFHRIRCAAELSWSVIELIHAACDRRVGDTLCACCCSIFVTDCVAYTCNLCSILCDDIYTTIVLDVQTIL